MKKIMILALTILCAFNMVACGGGGEGKTSGSDAKQTNASYTIATNNFGVGAYPLDMMVAYEQAACDATGMKLDVTNNEFTVDKVINQLQNQLAAGPDGVAFLGISETLFPIASAECKSAKIPYVFYACSPNETDMAKIEQDSYYTGMIIYDPVAEGGRVADLAIKDGCKTAVISAGAAGDYAHDRRIKGFTKNFEAGGGKVLFVSHSADPSEAVQKTNDFLTAYGNTDCIYGAGEDYTTAAANILESRGIKTCKVYGSNISPDVAKLIMDGKVKACTGGESACGSLAITLLINKLDGHPILDAAGKAPYFDNLQMFLVTSDNAEKFYNFLTDKTVTTKTISDEEYQQLLFRNNPKVDYKYYEDFLTGYENSVYKKIDDYNQK
jgi:ABC-type sugar transport system, periplasmic component